MKQLHKEIKHKKSKWKISCIKKETILWEATRTKGCDTQAKTYMNNDGRSLKAESNYLDALSTESLTLVSPHNRPHLYAVI